MPGECCRLRPYLLQSMGGHLVIRARLLNRLLVNFFKHGAHNHTGIVLNRLVHVVTGLRRMLPA